MRMAQLIARARKFIAARSPMQAKGRRFEAIIFCTRSTTSVSTNTIRFPDDRSKPHEGRGKREGEGKGNSRFQSLSLNQPEAGFPSVTEGNRSHPLGKKNGRQSDEKRKRQKLRPLLSSFYEKPGSPVYWWKVGHQRYGGHDASPITLEQTQHAGRDRGTRAVAHL